MVQCFSCQQNFGFLSKPVRQNFLGEEIRLCKKCFDKWPEESKKLTLQILYSGSFPNPVLILYNITRIADFEKNIRAIGSLLFTDKGVCFVQHGTLQGIPKPSVGGAIVGAVGGPVAGAIAITIAEKNRLRGEQQAETVNSALADAGKGFNFNDPADLRAAFENSEFLWFIPKGRIAAIEHARHAWWSGLWIKDKSMGKGDYGIHFDMDKKEYETCWRTAINEYLSKQ